MPPDSHPSPAPSGVPLASLVDLTGKVALVTGAAQGFGFACARRLAERRSVRGARRQAPRSTRGRAGRGCPTAGCSVATAEGDVSVEADVERLIDTAVERSAASTCS